MVVATATYGSWSANWPAEGRPFYENWMVQEIYSSVVERCEAAGIDPPNIVQTWQVDSGNTNYVYVDGGVTYTSVVPTYASVTTTNTIGTFVSGGYTGQTFLTRSFVNSLDTKIEELIPYFVITNEASGGNYLTWFNTELAVGFPDDFPMESQAGLFQREGIGFTTNLLTNSFGTVTSGEAYWTRQPPMTSHWVLAQAHYTKVGTWQSGYGNEFNRRYYGNVYPVIKYITAGPNPQANTITVTLSGLQIQQSDQDLLGAYSIISVTTEYTPLSKYWYRVEWMVANGVAANTNDSIQIVYTNETVLYGDRPFLLYGRDFDERQKALNAMRWTRQTPEWVAPTSGVTNYWEGCTDGGAQPPPPFSWNQAKADVEANWAPNSGLSPDPYWPILIPTRTWPKPIVGTLGRYGRLPLPSSRRGYEALALAKSYKAEIAAGAGNYSHLIQFYAKSRTLSQGIMWYALYGYPCTESWGRYKPDGYFITTYTNYGFNIAQDEYVIITEVPSTTAITNHSDTIGQTNAPWPVWVDQPVVYDSLTYNGFSIYKEQGLIKWDVTGGFNYVD